MMAYRISFRRFRKLLICLSKQHRAPSDGLQRQVSILSKVLSNEGVSAGFVLYIRQERRKTMVLSYHL